MRYSIYSCSLQAVVLDKTIIRYAALLKSLNMNIVSVTFEYDLNLYSH